MKFSQPIMPPGVETIAHFQWSDRAFQYEGCTYIVALGHPECFLFSTDADGTQRYGTARMLGDDITQAIKMWFDAEYEMPIADFLNSVLGL